MTFLLSGTSKNVVFPSCFFCLLLSLSYFPEKNCFFLLWSPAQGYYAYKFHQQYNKKIQKILELARVLFSQCLLQAVLEKITIILQYSKYKLTVFYGLNNGGEILGHECLGQCAADFQKRRQRKICFHHHYYYYYFNCYFLKVKNFIFTQ